MPLGMWPLFYGVHMTTESFVERSSAYLEAHKFAEQELRANRIRSFSCTHNRERGRQIFIETDQGWNPDPLYEDYPEDACANHEEAAYC